MENKMSRAGAHGSVIAIKPLKVNTCSPQYATSVKYGGGRKEEGRKGGEGTRTASQPVA